MKSIHNTMKFMDDKIEELLVKKVDGELSAKEEEFLSLWLAEDVEHERELQVFMAVRQRLSVLREYFRAFTIGKESEKKTGSFGALVEICGNMDISCRSWRVFVVA